jgi:hypothetical protein
MKTLIIAVTCFSLGAGISHAKDIADILGDIGKEPSKEETRAELQPTMNKMDIEGLQATLVDYAHRAKLLQIQIDKDRAASQKKSKIIFELRSKLRACEAK